ncbi:MAG: UvrD-helicase domain-containing protein [Clostridia bacterium]|nr:UvrD-helicase domain-containing protein [Clostridia bacterium]
MVLTDEQKAAIESRGKVIVSASAGSGKTFVMIEKLVAAVVNGADLDEVLAVTFTKKAAAQMKEKLRAALVKRIENAGEEKARLKLQLSKISSANISTIHSFCAKLLRTYFYALGTDGSFDIISADDAAARELKDRAMESLFDRLYEEDGEEFRLLLSCFMKKRNDGYFKKLVAEAHTELRAVAHYERYLEEAEKLYCEEGFGKVCADFTDIQKPKYGRLIAAVEKFQAEFPETKKKQTYDAIFEEMKAVLKFSSECSPFTPHPALTATRKPADCEEDKPAGEAFKKFKDGINKKYAALCGDFADGQTELERFLQSGKIAIAFIRLLLRFDAEYTAVKAEENKLDYNDLEHLTLKLFNNAEIREEIVSGYKYVFVDEYQDVNPVQEEIISALRGEVFLVGDVKQAIYGFRGSKSAFFSEKFEGFERGGGSALKLSSNFRSADGVLDFVNRLFSDIMRPELCGIDYVNTAKMRFGGLYPEGCGAAEIHIFGKEEEEERGLGVYSVQSDGRLSRHTREGLAVLALVESELQKKHFDLKTGEWRDTQAGDICILTRKNKGGSTEGIVRALLDEGYSVAGAQEANVCALPEVKQMLDILSLIDNAEQDYPLVTALLSPLGGFCEDELAAVRIWADALPAVYKDGVKERKTFRKCCEQYAVNGDEIARKLGIFRGKLEKLRSLAGILNAGELIDELLENYGFESALCAGGEQRAKNVLRLAEEGADLPLNAFLAKIKSGGYSVSAPSAASSDSIKIMSMHASKGLEFPVVIIADICKTFKGTDYGETPFDEKYGFAPKCYDKEKMLAHKTILRRLAKIRAESEELKNELNLFYVACTRAMCRLHILADEVPEFDGIDLSDAKRYSDLFDLSKFSPKEICPHSEFAAENEKTVFISAPDEELAAKIDAHFMKSYSHSVSVDLPVKSSASAILKLREDEPYFAPHSLFGGEGETGTERGTAYHRFLELCDFKIRTADGIRRELVEFAASGLITERQLALLNAEELEEILKMPAFTDLEGAKLFREREFLCRLPANEIFDTSAEDGVLVQGAIDLLADGGSEIKIIDYKYSRKPDKALAETYSKQLALYKKAVALIMKTPPEKIKTVIVNIYLKRQIDLN